MHLGNQRLERRFLDMFQKKAAVNAKDEKKTVTKKKKSGNVKAKLISVLKVVVLPALFAGIVVCGLYLSMQNKLEAESLKGQVIVMKENKLFRVFLRSFRSVKCNAKNHFIFMGYGKKL